MQKIQSRLPDVGTTIFTVMSKMALEHGAINLSQGFPDFSIDQKIIDLVHHYMNEGFNQYAPMPGVLALREIIAQVAKETYNHQVDPETEITVMAGGTEALYASIAAFVSPGDEVILFDPSYDSYNPAVRLNGGIPVHINLKFPSFSIDWDEVKAKVTSRTRMIIINSPHNPSGSVFSKNDLIELEKLALANNLIVLSDEVYERLIFDKKTHHSVLSLPPSWLHSSASGAPSFFSFNPIAYCNHWLPPLSFTHCNPLPNAQCLMP